MQILRQFAVASLLVLAACGKPAPSACAGEGISASNAWVRAAAEGGVSAGFVTLCNGGDGADRLVAARFDGAETVELHLTAMGDDGVARMTPIEGGLALPAGEETALAPGGAHIMLIGLTAPIAEGDKAAITLEFERAGPQTVTFEARSRVNAAH